MMKSLQDSRQERPDLCQASSQASNQASKCHLEVAPHDLVALLAPQFKSKTASEWLAEMDQRQVPCAPINDFADILRDPHIGHMGLVKPLELPNGAVTKTIGFPVSISNFQQADMRPPPMLGANNLAVYDDWLGQNI